jgi:hypothetical protein
MGEQRQPTQMDILMIQQLVAEGFLPPEEGDKLIARIEELLNNTHSKSASE